MIRETKVPAIPDVRDDNIKDVLRAIKATLDVREGSIGDPLDQSVTLRDLVDLNVAQTGGTTSTAAGGTLPVGGVLPPIVGGYNPTTDYTTPPQPTGLRAKGGFTNVFLEWDGAPYRNHSFTEIWRSETDNLGTAVMVGTTAASVYADAANANTRYFYWIRFVSVANITGPYNLTSGTQARTAIDVSSELEALSAEIQNSQLFVDLGTRIQSIESSQFISKAALAELQEGRTLLDSELSRTGSAVLNVKKVTDEQASILTALGTRVGNSESSILTLQQTTASQATSISQLNTRVGSAESNITNLQTTTSSQATSLTALTTRVGTAESSITSLQTTTANQATSITQLNSTVGGNTTSIQTLTTTTDGLSGQYTVKIDNNGYVSGFGLASTAVDGTPFSEFYVRADRFAIARPNQAKIGISSLSRTSPASVAISTITKSGSVATITTSAAHGFAVGANFTLEGITSNTDWNANYVVSEVVGATQFKFEVASYLPDVTSTLSPRVTAFAVATLVTASSHGLVAGSQIPVAGVTNDVGWNRTWKVASVTNSTTVTFLAPANLTTPAVVASAETGVKIPFIVDSGKVWMDSAMIREATIESAQIRDLVAEKITTGSLTATIGVSTGKIYGGVNIAQAFGTTNFGTGFFLGLDSSIYKFYVGSPTQNMKWDGSSLSVTGNINATSGTFRGITVYDASNNVILSSGGVPSSAVSGLGALASLNTVGSSHIDAGAVGITQLGTTIQTTNFSSTEGWQITKAGGATFNNVALRGAINGGAYTGYAWPTSGVGFHLGPNGLLMGNINSGKYFQVTAEGDVYAPGFNVVNGQATFSGLLANTITVTSGQVIGLLMKTLSVPVTYSGIAYDMWYGGLNSSSVPPYTINGQPNRFLIWSAAMPAPETAAHKIACTVTANSENNRGGQSGDFVLEVYVIDSFSEYTATGTLIGVSSSSTPYNQTATVAAASTATYNTEKIVAIVATGYVSVNQVTYFSGLFWGVR